MNQVIAFKDSIPPGEVNPDMVKCMEELLSRARSGELRGFAYAAVGDSGNAITGWEGSDGSRNPMAASIMMLHHRYVSRLMEAVE